MSFETGRKLGLTGSLILVVLPIIIIGALFSFIAVLVSSFGNITAGTIPNVGVFGGLSIAFVVVVGIGAFLALIAIILLLIALHNLSEYYHEPGIFKGILYAFIINIVSAVVLVVMEFLVLIPSVVEISRVTTTTPNNIFGGGFIIGFIAIAAVAIVLGIISAVLVYRSFTKLGEKSEVDSFKTAGLLYLIGVLIPFIGSIIAWIGFILAAIGFHRLRPVAVTPAVTYPTETPSPAPLQTKRCPYCSTDNQMDATYCRFCGKPLQ